MMQLISIEEVMKAIGKDKQDTYKLINTRYNDYFVLKGGEIYTLKDDSVYDLYDKLSKEIYAMHSIHVKIKGIRGYLYEDYPLVGNFLYTDWALYDSDEYIMDDSVENFFRAMNVYEKIHNMYEDEIETAMYAKSTGFELPHWLWGDGLSIKAYRNYLSHPTCEIELYDDKYTVENFDRTVYTKYYDGREYVTKGTIDEFKDNIKNHNLLDDIKDYPHYGEIMKIIGDSFIVDYAPKQCIFTNKTKIMIGRDFYDVGNGSIKVVDKGNGKYDLVYKNMIVKTIKPNQ